MSVDPLTEKYPFLTPYQYASNSPISGIDLDGLEHVFYMLAFDDKQNITVVNVLELDAKLETIFGTVHDFNIEDKTYLYGTDGSWHIMPDEWRNQSLANAGDMDDIMEMANKWPNGDKVHNIAKNVQSLQRLSQTAGLAVGLVMVVDGLKNLKPQNLRQLYTNAVGELKGVGQNLLRQGFSKAEVASKLNGMRRSLGEVYKDMTPKDLRQYIYKFNEKRYGDKLGPTYEKLKQMGKTDDQIIESASRPLGDMKDLGKALFKEFGDEIKPILQKYKMLE